MSVNNIPDTGSSLFWYPDLKYKYDFDKGIDKPLLMQSYIRYYLNRLQSMFKWEGLPDTIPAKWLESYLLVDGYCCIINTDKGLIATNGGIGADPNEYYIPTKFIVSNPYIPDKYSAGRNYTVNTIDDSDDAVFVRNDIYTVGLMPLLVKYCSQMVENDISMNIADIMSRATVALSAADDQTKASAEQWLKDIIKGKVGIIGETPFLVANQEQSLRTNPIGTVAGTLTDLIEYHQYLKAGLFNEIGLNSNYNMKREAINSNESQLNDDALHPFIDTMLECRKEAAEQMNKMFGTNITVEFNSAWEENEKENDLMLDQMENAADQTEEGFIEDTDEVETDDDTEFIEETDEVSPETTTEEVITEAAESIVEKVEELIEEKDGDDNDIGNDQT
jgi:hypothetical protein